MKRYIGILKRLAFTSTAKDTYILFGGNVLSAFLGFLFTLIVARALSVSDFGVFSAANNLVIIIASLTDLGISSAVINFASRLNHIGERKKANEYIKAAYLIRIVTVLLFSLVIVLFSKTVSKSLLATDDANVAFWVAILSVAIFSWAFFPCVLQARKHFLKSALIEVFLPVVRLVLLFVLFWMGLLTVTSTLVAFSVSAFITLLFSFLIVGFDFLKEKPKIEIYKNLVKFSGWLGVNKVVSSVSGRLDVQMLAYLAGATSTGLYSIPARLSTFVIVLAGSLSSVFATRFASFSSKEKEKVYLKKTTLAILPVVCGIIFWIIIAKPFILILFGEKYLPAVGVFQALTTAMIPFLISVPAANAIIYAMKKPIFIGIYSIFQTILIFVLNLIFIPKFNAYGPTITFGIAYTIAATYVWVIVIKHYWLDDEN